MSTHLFSDDKVNLRILKERATGMRWGAVPEGTIPLTAADPDFPPAREITDAMIEYIKGEYLPYPAATGLTGLREIISQRMLERKNINAPVDQIVLVDSAASAMRAIACSVLEPGDEAIIFDPVDLLFGISVRAAKGKVVYFPSVYKDGHWDLSSLESYVTPRTRMICLCNPHNPMGLLYTREELEHIAQVADRHGLWIMNDEIWSDIIYSEKPFVSISSLGPELNKRTISCYGFSKGFALAGMRAGYIYTLNKDAFEAVSPLASAWGVDVVTQVAMKAAFEHGYGWVDQFVAHLQKCRDHIYNRFSRMPLIRATKQEATFVTFPNISATGMDSQGFVDWLSKEHKVQLVPGTEFWFGPRAEGHVRLCFSTSMGILDEALDRIEEGLRELASAK